VNEQEKMDKHALTYFREKLPALQAENEQLRRTIVELETKVANLQHQLSQQRRLR
jgi:cell division protein FtsB